MIDTKMVGKMVGVVATSLVLVSLLLVSGCARHPSEKELGVLEQQRKAAESAEKTLAAKKGQKAELERQVAQKKAELKRLEEKRDAVKKAKESSQ